MFRKPYHLGILFLASLTLAAALPREASAQFSLRTPGFRLSVGNGYYNNGYYNNYGYYNYVQPTYVAPATYVTPAPIVYPNYSSYGAASYAYPGYVAPVVNTGVYYNSGYNSGYYYGNRRFYGGRYWR
jgi:hypothetical protein